MKYATEGAFRTALEARFLKLAGPNNDKQLVRFRRGVEGRGVQPLPSRLPKPGEHWRLPYARLAREVELPENLDDGFAAAAAFLDPALAIQGDQPLAWVPERWEWRVADAR